MVATDFDKDSLKALQAKLGLSNRDFAKELRIDENTLGRIYSGATKRISSDIVNRAKQMPHELVTQEKKEVVIEISITPNYFEKQLLIMLRKLPDGTRLAIAESILKAYGQEMRKLSRLKD